MKGKRTGQPIIPANAIVVDVLVVGGSSGDAEVTLGEMLEFVGEDRFNDAMNHLYELFVFDVLSNEASPIHGVFREAFRKLKEHSMAHLHESHERISQLEGELKEMRIELRELRGRTNSLEASLQAVRKCLKADGVKQALAYCQRVRRQPPDGEAAEAALVLAEGVKDACICIRTL